VTTEKAIERSISHNEIVTLRTDTRDEYDALCSALSSESDDDVEHVTSEGDIHEYWGDLDGDDWRVHVRLIAR
jgi:hypothetical protein